MGVSYILSHNVHAHTVLPWWGHVTNVSGARASAEPNCELSEQLKLLELASAGAQLSSHYTCVNSR